MPTTLNFGNEQKALPSPIPDNTNKIESIDSANKLYSSNLTVLTISVHKKFLKKHITLQM